MSCAAPMRALWPERASTTSSPSPAARAMALRMRGTWLGCRASPGVPSLRSDRNRPPVGNVAAAQPLGQYRHGVAGDVDRGRPAGGIGLAARDQQRGRAPRVALEVGEAGRAELGTAQHGVVRHRHQGAVARVDQPLAGGAEELPAERPGQAVGLPLAVAAPPVHALQRELHDGALGGVGEAGGAVRRGDAGDVAAHGGRGANGRHVVDEQGERGRSGGTGVRATRPGPLGEQGEVVATRALGAVAERAARRPGGCDQLVEGPARRAGGRTGFGGGRRGSHPCGAPVADSRGRR